MTDTSAGYEFNADAYLAARSDVGTEVISDWARRNLPSGSAILDAGCGSGWPVASALSDIGLAVHGIDASPRLVAEFRRRLPGLPVACETIETTSGFGRQFEAVLAIGVLFLFPEARQLPMLRALGRMVMPRGHLLFTAPAQPYSWMDAVTAQPSCSLGTDRYEELLADAGFDLANTFEDEGENHYLHAVKRAALPT
ncbi:MAG: class I SAM-dependent methyltransferase [Pacificimonas sp.]